MFNLPDNLNTAILYQSSANDQFNVNNDDDSSKHNKRKSKKEKAENPDHRKSKKHKDKSAKSKDNSEPQSDSKSKKKKKHKHKSDNEDEKKSEPKVKAKKKSKKKIDDSDSVESDRRKSKKKSKHHKNEGDDDRNVDSGKRREKLINEAATKGKFKLVDFTQIRGTQLQQELEKQNKEREERMLRYVQFEEADHSDSDNSDHLDEKIAALENELKILKENIKSLMQKQKDSDTIVESKAILLRKKDWLTFKSLELEHLFDSTGYKYEMLDKKHKAIHEALKNIESVKTDMKKIVHYRAVLNKLQYGLGEAEKVITEMQSMAYKLLPSSVSRHCQHVEATRKRLMDMQDDLMEKKHFAKKELVITKKEIVAINQAIEGELEATALLETRREQELQRLVNFQAKNNEIDEIIANCNSKLNMMNLTLEEAQEIANNLAKDSRKSKKNVESDDNVKGNIKENKITETKQMIEMMKEQIAKVDEQIAQMDKEISKNQSTAKLSKDIIEILDKINKATTERRLLTEKLQTERVLRKTYYNQIEDMKGAIRVYCRVRPLIKTEKERNDDLCVEFPDIYTITIKQPDKKNPAERSKEYLFDRVFPLNSTQIDVFKDIDRLIETVFTGFNVCIFAYGQTGSGKTYTLIGDMNSKVDMGVVPRAFVRFYEIIDSNKLTTKTDTNFYMIELYNDKLLDLMKSDAVYVENLKIIKNEHGMVIVPGVTMLNAQSTADMVKYFHIANNNRHIASTKMNSESSRSHLILTIMFTFTNISNNKKFFGKLSMVDLAGSERIGKSGVTGINKTEATSINKALTALGDVISALTSMNKGFVPYRNNRLTQLMQDSLGGTAKTLLIVNLSPVQYNVSESISSLNYAARMKTIVNENLKVADDDEVNKLKDILNKLLRGEPVVIP